MYVVISVCKCLHCEVCNVCMQSFIVVSGFFQVRSQDTNDDAHTHTYIYVCTYKQHTIHLEYYINYD